jgi:hypothetical protein
MLNIVQLKKLQTKLILIMGCLLGTFQTVSAVERLGYVGQTWSFPLFLRSPHSYDEITYHLDTAYFLHEKVSAALSIDTQVDGLQLFYLEFGPDFYPIQDSWFLPYMSARLLYTMVPSGAPGWLVNLGFETRLSSSYETENLRLRVNTGIGQFITHSDNFLFIELIRIGLIWSF